MKKSSSVVYAVFFYPTGISFCYAINVVFSLNFEFCLLQVRVHFHSC